MNQSRTKVRAKKGNSARSATKYNSGRGWCVHTAKPLLHTDCSIDPHGLSDLFTQTTCWSDLATLDSCLCFIFPPYTPPQLPNPTPVSAHRGRGLTGPGMKIPRVFVVAEFCVFWEPPGMTRVIEVTWSLTFPLVSKPLAWTELGGCHTPQNNLSILKGKILAHTSIKNVTGASQETWLLCLHSPSLPKPSLCNPELGGQF